MNREIEGGTEPVSRLGPSGFVPEREEWFADKGSFWGTTQQLLVCARCGQHEHKRHDEPRHYQQILSPFMHHLCDACYDELPENGLRRYAIATEAGTAETVKHGSVHEGLCRRGAVAVRTFERGGGLVGIYERAGENK